MRDGLQMLMIHLHYRNRCRPHPMIVRDFNSIVGKNSQFQEVGGTKYPDFIVACVEGGSSP